MPDQIPIIPTISKPKTSSKDVRGIIAFPKIDEFYDELFDRLYMVLDQFFLEEKFTLFINALPRDHQPGTRKQIGRFSKVELIYAGIKRQCTFLTENQTILNDSLKPHWKTLQATHLTTQESKVSLELYDKLKRGSYKLSDITVGNLKQYFESKLQPDLNLSPLTTQQEAEYHILNTHFDISTYHYLSVPLIQFAEFDGVVHIILSEDDYLSNLTDRNAKINAKTVGNIIKAFSREYEGLILDWDIVGGARLKKDSFTDALVDDALYEYNEHDNPILKELKYREYYKKHQKYFDDRFRYNKRIPSDIIQQYRQIAIMHILIDSYAHNISAHSLTALEWWFRQRVERMEKQKNDEFVPLSEIVMLNQLDIPLDRNIHPLLRFLLDKGAFWTGLTRDYSFGGRIMSLYRVLWHDFINNPLYLGSIAYTEGITKVNINVTFLKAKENVANAGVLFQKKIEVDGNFAQIDLSKFYDNSIYRNIDADLEQITDFVTPGSSFRILRKKLRRCKAFFPAGVVGEHAFFTILENELRNVKHYSLEDLEAIRKTGLTLNISVEEATYHPKKNIDPDQTHYYKIGVWLKHPLEITKELLLLRPNKLNSEIMENADKNFRPKLGGTYQDKVCAAMLFNNSFAKIEDKSTTRGRQFYPWIKAGCTFEVDYEQGDTIYQYELSARRLSGENEFKASRQFFDDNFKQGMGYFKKIFHVWKGENICHAKNLQSLDKDGENIARFRFVYLPTKDALSFQHVRETGTIRIINQLPDEDDLEQAYRFWLNQWLQKKGEDKEHVIELIRDDCVVGHLGLNAKEVFHKNAYEIPTEKPAHSSKIILAHKSDQKDGQGRSAVRYRNHGIFIKYFCKNPMISEASIKPDRAGELLETLRTKICIFDRRVFKRFDQFGEENNVFKEQLRLDIRQENVNEWEAIKRTDLFNYHFVVIHLSFIETLGGQKGKYKEDDIQKFIDNEILQDRIPPENFVLVITTGRGRTQWWDNLQRINDPDSIDFQREAPPYTSFVTFRPVESITSAIENALAMRDDFELKYRLVKVLFGS